jgi:hypothetical protein
MLMVNVRYICGVMLPESLFSENPILILVRSLWGLELTKVSLGQVFSESSGFPLPLAFNYRSTPEAVQCKQLTASLKRALLTFKPLSS